MHVYASLHFEAGRDHPSTSIAPDQNTDDVACLKLSTGGTGIALYCGLGDPYRRNAFIDYLDDLSREAATLADRCRAATTTGGDE